MLKRKKTRKLPNHHQLPPWLPGNQTLLFSVPSVSSWSSFSLNAGTAKDCGSQRLKGSRGLSDVVVMSQYMTRVWSCNSEVQFVIIKFVEHELLWFIFKGILSS